MRGPKYIYLRSLTFQHLFILFISLLDVGKAEAQTYTPYFYYKANACIDYINFTVGGLSETAGYLGAAYKLPQKQAEGTDRIYAKSLYFRSRQLSDTEKYQALQKDRSRPDIQKLSDLYYFCDTIHSAYNQIVNRTLKLRNIIYYKSYEKDSFYTFRCHYDTLERQFERYDSLINQARAETDRLANQALSSDPHLQIEMQMRQNLNRELELFREWYLSFENGEIPYQKIESAQKYLNEYQTQFTKNPNINEYTRDRYFRYYHYLLTDLDSLKKHILNQKQADGFHHNTTYLSMVNMLNIRCAYEHDQFVRSCKAVRIYLFKYIRQPYIFKINAPLPETIPDDKPPLDKLYESLDGYADNHLILLLDVSGSMAAEDRLPLLKKSFLRLLPILRPNDKITIVIYSGKAQTVLSAVPGNEKAKIKQALLKSESGGSTNIDKGLELAAKTAEQHFIPGGNNRIILATDGKFQIDTGSAKIIKKMAKRDVVLSIFHFGSETENRILKRMAKAGKGNYVLVTPDNADLVLIKEAKAVQKNPAD